MIVATGAAKTRDVETLRGRRVSCRPRLRGPRRWSTPLRPETKTFTSAHRLRRRLLRRDRRLRRRLGGRRLAFSRDGSRRTLHLARRRGLRAGAICTVDGNLVEGTQKGTDTEDDELPRRPRTTSAAPSTLPLMRRRRCSSVSPERLEKRRPSRLSLGALWRPPSCPVSDLSSPRPPVGPR